MLRNRPTLRAQLALLYGGGFVALCTVMLLAVEVLPFHSSQSVSSLHGLPGTGPNGRTFDVVPAIVFAVGALGSVAAGWWIAGRVLRPLRTMTTAAREISASDLHRRLAVDWPGRELTELGRTLDDLFARLEASFEAERHFVANASHELRTPLAGQRTLLQVALADPAATTSTLRAACEEALQLGARQERLIDALLTLAVSQQGLEVRRRVDLAAVATGAVAGRRGSEAGIDLRVDAAPVSVTGDTRLLESLAGNLVDNALRHNRPGGWADVTVHTVGGRPRLVVRNCGPAVAEADIQRLLRPFQRVESTRTGDGLGLGLAIVAAIAAAHGARLDVRPAGEEGGLEVTVDFPPPAGAERNG